MTINEFLEVDDGKVLPVEDFVTDREGFIKKVILDYKVWTDFKKKVEKVKKKLGKRN